MPPEDGYQRTAPADPSVRLAQFDGRRPVGRTERGEATLRGRSREARRVIDETMERLSGYTTRLGSGRGLTPAETYDRFFARNSKISDEQIIAMSQYTLDQFRTPQETATERAEMAAFGIPPDSTPHRFNTQLVAGIMGVDPSEVSAAAPALGITGSPGRTARLRASGMSTETMKQSITDQLQIHPEPSLRMGTVLHDTTSYFDGLGLNRSMWGIDDNEGSALVMFFDRYPDPPPERRQRRDD